MKAWMIKTPDGELLVGTLSRFKARCQANFITTYNMVSTNESWSDFKKQGYKCVRVTIKEDK